jgi:hypothetical protein
MTHMVKPFAMAHMLPKKVRLAIPIVTSIRILSTACLDSEDCLSTHQQRDARAGQEREDASVNGDRGELYRHPTMVFSAV